MVRAAGEQPPEDFKDLHEALVSTDSVEQFLHEMAILAARLVRGPVVRDDHAVQRAAGHRGLQRPGGRQGG